jgi:hypothetical protein
MPDYDRDYFRFACVLQQELGRLHSQEAALSLPRWEWQRCHELWRKFDKARSHHLTAAAATLAGNLEAALFRLREQLTSQLAAHGSLASVPKIPTLRALYDEVAGVFAEFETVACNLKKRLLVVTTDPIELKDVYLGEFEIRLDLNELGKPFPYEVVALNANPFAGNESITHPHVQDNHLCEGEGKVPIQRALATGRLADFFQIVNQILNTYNPGSAYASLGSWSGSRCTECGLTVSADDLQCCDQCDSSSCDECISFCERCEIRICSSCSQSCAHCGRCACNGCLEACEDCEDNFCQSCLSHGKCKTCHDSDRNESDPGAGDATPVAPGPSAAGETNLALQPAGLEQAAVLA